MVRGHAVALANLLSGAKPRRSVPFTSSDLHFQSLACHAVARLTPCPSSRAAQRASSTDEAGARGMPKTPPPIIEPCWSPHGWACRGRRRPGSSLPSTVHHWIILSEIACMQPFSLHPPLPVLEAASLSPIWAWVERAD